MTSSDWRFQSFLPPAVTTRRTRDRPCRCGKLRVVPLRYKSIECPFQHSWVNLFHTQLSLDQQQAIVTVSRCTFLGTHLAYAPKLVDKLILDYTLLLLNTITHNTTLFSSRCPIWQFGRALRLTQMWQVAYKMHMILTFYDLVFVLENVIFISIWAIVWNILRRLWMNECKLKGTPAQKGYSVPQFVVTKMLMIKKLYLYKFPHLNSSWGDYLFAVPSTVQRATARTTAIDGYPD